MWQAFKFVIRLLMICDLEALLIMASSHQDDEPLVPRELLHGPVSVERAHRVISKVLLCRPQSSEITLNR